MSDINLPAVLVANGLGVWLMAVVLRAERYNAYDTSFGHTTFWAMCRLNFILCLLETVSFLADGQQFRGAPFLLRLINVLLFLLDISFACLWAFYADYKIFEDTSGLRRRAKWLALPALCTVVLCLLNLRFDLFFSLDAANTYSRRTPVVFLYLVTYLYLMYGALLPLFANAGIAEPSSSPWALFCCRFSSAASCNSYPVPFFPDLHSRHRFHRIPEAEAAMGADQTGKATNAFVKRGDAT